MAFGLQLKRKAILENILKDQKTISRHPLFKIFKLKPLYLKYLFPIIILGFIGHFVNPTQLFHSLSTGFHVDSFKVIFVGEFPASVRESIYQNANSTISANKRVFSSASDLAHLIQKKEGMALVQVFLDINNRATLSMRPRIPLVALSNTGFVISYQGDVYKDSNFKPKLETSLEGIFQDEKNLQLDDENRVVKTSDENTAILNAIELILSAQKRGLLFSSLEFKRYRGYIAHLRDSRTSVVFGFPPYEKQLVRLEKLFEEAKEKGIILTLQVLDKQ